MTVRAAFDRARGRFRLELRAAALAVSAGWRAYRRQRSSSLLEAARSGPGTPIALVCFPKSASTFFAYALAGATRRRVVPAVPAFGRREQEFDVFGTLALRNRAVVLQSHTRYSDATRELLHELGTAPVLIVRDVFDALMSLWDHLREEGPDVPMAVVDWPDLDRDDDAMLDFLTDIVAPWYVQFYAGWMRASASGAVRLLVLDYDTITTDTAAAVDAVSAHVGDVHPAGDSAAGAIEGVRLARPRFNHGTGGRGRRFGPTRVARVARVAEHYPDVDFRAIGIPHPTGDSLGLRRTEV